MIQIPARWNKISSKPDEWTDVVLLGFGQASNSNTHETRPVAIVSDLSDNGRLRYAELKFIRIEVKYVASP